MYGARRTLYNTLREKDELITSDNNANKNYGPFISLNASKFCSKSMLDRH